VRTLRDPAGNEPSGHHRKRKTPPVFGMSPCPALNALNMRRLLGPSVRQGAACEDVSSGRSDVPHQLMYLSSHRSALRESAKTAPERRRKRVRSHSRRRGCLVDSEQAGKCGSPWPRRCEVSMCWSGAVRSGQRTESASANLVCNAE